jgi:hypothetical protein
MTHLPVVGYNNRIHRIGKKGRLGREAGSREAGSALDNGQGLMKSIAQPDDQPDRVPESREAGSALDNGQGLMKSIAQPDDQPDRVPEGSLPVILFVGRRKTT